MSDQSWDLILPFFKPEIQELILDPTVSDICFNGQRSIWIERKGIMYDTGLTIDAETLNAVIQQIARGLGQDLSEQHPILDTRLPNGSRVSAVGPPCSTDGSTLTIRKLNTSLTTENLIHGGSIPREICERVLSEILGTDGPRRNIAISGGTGSGKTIMLNAFAQHIPATDRMVIIEKPMELDIRQSNAARWEAVDAVPGRNPVSVEQLVTAALRHRPDRIIIGEVRDHSAYDMLLALNTGHAGLTTVHADNAYKALDRISTLALSAHPNLGQGFVRNQTASAIHFVLHVTRDPDGHRHVAELCEVLGYDDATNKFRVESIYKYGEIMSCEMSMLDLLTMQENWSAAPARSSRRPMRSRQGYRRPRGNPSRGAMRSSGATIGAKSIN